MSKLSQYIESLIFVAETPISVKDIRESLMASIKMKASKDKVAKAIAELQEKFNNEEHSFELVGIADGYQFMTKTPYHEVVGMYLRIQSKKKLSRASMETLAIIAYKQPITKSGIESIRGVNCDYAVLKLVEKELVEILGRAQTPGRPILYGTSDKFMDYFGIKDITDLPKLKEIIVSESSIGMEEGLTKMHTEGLTEDFQFLPSEEVEVTETIETTEESTSENKEENNAEEVTVADNPEVTAEEPQEETITDTHEVVDDNTNAEIQVAEITDEVEAVDLEESFLENKLDQDTRNEEGEEGVNSEEN